MSIELGLVRIRALLKNTPLPWRAVHVAGTNGKGTVCHWISKMLRAADIRTGHFVSPHTIDRWDCIQINNKNVSKSDFLRIEQRVADRDKLNQINATPFELLTATAFELFTERQVEVGVVEVGMGGRLDATNVLENPLVSLITRIGYDHQQYLGSTLPEIAREKAGICKPGVPVLISDDNLERTRTIIWEVAERVHAIPTALVLLPKDADSLALHPVPKAIKTAYLAAESAVPVFQAHPATRFLPRFQRNNIILAYVGAQVALSRLSRPPPTAQQLNSWNGILTSAEIPGRQQKLSIKSLTGRPNRVLLDGAHNTQSAEELARAVESQLRPNSIPGKKPRPITWVLAFSRGKDVRRMLEILLQSGDRVVCCEFGPVDGMPWVATKPSGEVVNIIRAMEHLRLEKVEDCGKDVLQALRKGTALARVYWKWKDQPIRQVDGPLVVAGSLYLVGDVLRLKREKSLEKRAKAGEQVKSENEGKSESEEWSKDESENEEWSEKEREAEFEGEEGSEFFEVEGEVKGEVKGEGEGDGEGSEQLNKPTA